MAEQSEHECVSTVTQISLQRADAAGRRRRRLQTLYLVAAAGFAALVPLVLFAGLWVRAELDKSQRDIDLFLGERAQALSRTVDSEIQNQLSALRALSALPDLASADFRARAQQITATMPHWTSLSLFEAGDGRLLGKVGPDTMPTPADALVQDARERRAPVIETRVSTPGVTACILLYFPALRESAASFVLVTTFDGRNIQDLALSYAHGNNLVSTVIDGKNRTLGRSLDPETTLGQAVSDEFREATGGREAGHFRAASREGEPIYNTFVRSPLTGWVSVVTANQRQVDRLSTRSVWATIATGTVSLILAGILAVFIIHTILERRVSDERFAASRALGDLDARLLATTQEALGEQRKASSEREVLLREIYHRVKNNLQIVQSLLRLGSRDLRSEQREPFENAVRRIGAMARVHTLLYNSPDLASIDFKDYLDELLKELSEGFAAEERQIETVLEANAMRMSLDTAVPLAFIAVEILTNSFKHGFPEGRAGRISVAVRREGAVGCMTIRDDGVGLAPPQPGKRRLGLTIVRKLVQQIGGTLQEPPPGSSTFVIRFPLLSELDEDPDAGDAAATAPSRTEAVTAAS